MADVSLIPLLFILLFLTRRWSLQAPSLLQPSVCSFVDQAFRSVNTFIAPSLLFISAGSVQDAFKLCLVALSFTSLCEVEPRSDSSPMATGM